MVCNFIQTRCSKLEETHFPCHDDRSTTVAIVKRLRFCCMDLMVSSMFIFVDAKLLNLDSMRTYANEELVLLRKHANLCERGTCSSSQTCEPHECSLRCSDETGKLHCSLFACAVCHTYILRKVRPIETFSYSVFSFE